MLRLFGLGIGALWVVVGWRNLPPLEDGSALAAGIGLAVTCWVSWWCGKTQTGARAMAVATARAEARAAAHAASSSRSAAQAVVNVYPPAPRDATGEVRSSGPVYGEMVSGLDAAPWIGGPREVIEQDVLESIVDDIGEDYGVHESA